MRLVILCLLFCLNINFLYAYIDPGTGGYLISTLFSTIVGFLVLVLGVVLRFFRHTLKRWIIKFWNLHKIIFVFTSIIIVGGVSYFAYLQIIPSENLILPEYNENLNGVQSYNKSLAYNGYNLYNGKLLDMNGNIVKKWTYSYLSVIDKEGNYYAQKGYETKEWGKFDFNDNPIWIKEMPIHHEIYITPENTIITFTKEAHKYNGRMVEFDVIVEFDKNGKELDRWSTWDNLEMLQQHHRPLELDNEKSFFIPEEHKKNTSIWGANYDYYHLNSFNLVPKNDREGMHPAFNEGNWILSFRHGSMLFILDKNTREVLWKAVYDQVSDNLEGQHAPSMLKNGNIMVFDNGRYREWSRLIEIDTVTLDVVREYKNENFFTYSQGYYQNLANKNILITESEKGHVFEITKDEEIVWEYYEPQFKEHEDFGTIREELYRMSRYNKDFIDELLN